MSPVEDLSAVAVAGWEAGRRAVGKALTDPMKAKAYGRELVRKDLGQGGRFDYQRLWSPDAAAPGYLQLRQFRDVSNFNVGLYMQKVGLFPRDWVLEIAGEYAKEHSSNYMPGEPYGLDPRVKRWIERGYEAGESGAFNLPFLLKKEQSTAEDGRLIAVYSRPHAKRALRPGSASQTVDRTSLRSEKSHAFTSADPANASRPNRSR